MYDSSGTNDFYLPLFLHSLLLLFPPLFFSIPPSIPPSLLSTHPLINFFLLSLHIALFTSQRSPVTPHSLILQSLSTTQQGYNVQMTRQGIASPSHPHEHTLDNRNQVDAQGLITAVAPNVAATTTLESQELMETTTAALDTLVSKTGHKKSPRSTANCKPFLFPHWVHSLSLFSWRPFIAARKQ